MRKKDKTVEIPLHGQQWRCLQVIAGAFEGTGVTVDKLRKYIDDKPQRIRSYLSDLVLEGYLDGETFLLTKNGKEAYEKQMFWKNELIWWMAKLRVPDELIERQTDILLDTMEPELIRRIYIQNEYLRTLEKNRSSQEAFHNSDLSGKLQRGIYKAKIVFLDSEKRQGESEYSGLSDLNRYFSSMAELIVEPLKSCLVLKWQSGRDILREAVYLWEGRERRREAQGNQLRIPVADLNFVYVRTYRMLEGELDMTVEMTDSEGSKKVWDVRLLVSLPANDRR